MKTSRNTHTKPNKTINQRGIGVAFTGFVTNQSSTTRWVYHRGRGYVISVNQSSPSRWDEGCEDSFGGDGEGCVIGCGEGDGNDVGCWVSCDGGIGCGVIVFGGRVTRM
ncbi:hypothetical protein ACFE04_011528 [Oxalis oulophora]